jgi:hypothetical protein
MVASALHQELKSHSDDRERAVVLGGLVQKFHPDDVSYFVRLFINKPSEPEKRLGPLPILLITPAEYNEFQPRHLKVKWGSCQSVPRIPHKRCKTKATSKMWQRATQASKSVMSDFASAYPPVGTQEALHKWMAKSVKWPRYSGEDAKLEQNGLKCPPSHFQVTATIYALVYYSKREKRKASMYQIKTMLDRMENRRFTLWSEYPGDQLSTAPVPEMFIIVEKGQKIVEIKFLDE